MKIHSLNFRKEDIPQNISFTSNNTLKSNDKNRKDLNVKKIIPLTKIKKKEKVNKDENKKTNYKNNINDEDQEFNQIVPQKILKFNKKALSLKKKNLNEKNIKLYQNALIDKLQFVVKNSNHPNKNKSLENANINKIEVQFNLSKKSSKNSLFNNYKDYQKEFFSSVYNFNSNQKYSIIGLNKIKSSTLTPINNEPKNKNLKNNKNKSKFSRAVSNILQRKYHGKLPIFVNSTVSFMKNFKSNSEKERDDKNSHALLRLRDFLDIYWDKRKELVSEFFYTYKVKGDEYYTLKNLENFAHYVYDNIDDNTNVTKGIIETRIPMKEIIEKGIKYNNYYFKKLNNSKSLQKINNNSLNQRIKKKHLTGNNWYNLNKTKKEKEINNYKRNNVYRKSQIFIKNLGDININNYFYNDNYINNKYDLSDRENNQQILSNEKIEKYRKYLNKNYGAKVYNKFMRKYNQEEKDLYFNKRKVGTIDISNKNNLVNNINKQSNFYKLKSTSFSVRNNQPIYTFSEKDFKELFNELEEAKESYLYKNDNKNRGNEEENIWTKMYENAKKEKFEKNPELILKKKKKLLEYIIYQNIKERKEMEKDLLKNNSK